MMKIKEGVFIAVFVLCVIPLLLVSSFLIYQNDVSTKKLFKESLAVAMDAQFATLNKYFNDERIDLEIISLLPSAQNLLHQTEENTDRDKEYLNQLLAIRTLKNPNVERITLFNKDLEVLATSHDGEHVVRLSSEAVTGEVYTNNIAFTDVRYSVAFEKDVVDAIYEIRENDVLLGYFLKVYNLDFFQSLRTDISLWEDAAFYILDGVNKIIAAESHQTLGENLTYIGREQMAYYHKLMNIDKIKESKGSFEFRVAGDRYVTTYAITDYGEWMVLLAVNLDSHLNSEKNLMVVIGVLIVIGFFTSYWFNRYFNKKILTPIQLLTSSLETVRNNKNYALRLPITTSDEFGDIFKEINILLDHIQEKTQKEQAKQEVLKTKAEIDLLSGLYNKITVTEKITQELQMADPNQDHYALMIVDFDYFKEVNDTFGHMYGDAVITQFGEGLKRIFSENDILGRVGGDEFFVFLKNYHARELVIKKANLVNRLAKELAITEEGKSILSTSIGIALSPQDARDFETLYYLADTALYQAKENGRDGYAFYELIF